MSQSQVAIVLEVLSFVFVTIDLYGKRRLLNTQEKLLSFSDSFLKQINQVSQHGWNKGKSRKLMRIIYIISLFTGMLGPYFYVKDALSSPYTEFEWMWVFLTMGIGYVISLLVILFGILILLILFLFFMWIGRSILQATIWILKLINFEGLLIIVGTLLFFLGKYLEYQV